MKPLNDNIIVKNITLQQTTKSGIVLATAQKKQKSCIAQVVAIGVDCGNDIHAGDQIVYAKYVGTEIKIGEQNYVIIRYNDVLGIIQREE